MASNYEATISDFDLNFFPQASSNSVVPSTAEKQRKAIRIAKKKTVATDLLIKKYYTKKEALEQTERILSTSKEECKQICLNYKNVVEKCLKLEEVAQVLQNRSKELEDKFVTSETRYSAIQSHANQLQMLVKEHETLIEGLKIEKKIEHSNASDLERKCSNLEKRNEILMKNLSIAAGIILNKKKVKLHHKTLLQKYYEGDNGSESDESSTNGDENNQDDYYSDNEDKINNKQFLKSVESINVKHSAHKDEIIKDINGDDSHNIEASNEVVSVDTGRGSSLAFSDGEKFNSPDYSGDDSPLTSDILETNERVKRVNTGSSPIMISDTVDRASSPFLIKEFKESVATHSKQHTNVSTSPIVFELLSNTNIMTKPIDKSISISAEKKQEKLIINPFEKILHEKAISPVVFTDVSQKELIKLKRNDKECLKLNDSSHLDEESTDCEIQMILNEVRWNHKLVTPIPTTPSKSRNNNVCLDIPSLPQNEHVSHNNLCPEAAKIREENKMLHTSIADLAKEIMNIKSLLINQLPLDSNLNHGIVNNVSSFVNGHNNILPQNDETSFDATNSIQSYDGQENSLPPVHREPSGPLFFDENTLPNMDNATAYESTSGPLCAEDSNMDNETVYEATGSPVHTDNLMIMENETANEITGTSLPADNSSTLNTLNRLQFEDTMTNTDDELIGTNYDNSKEVESEKLVSNEVSLHHLDKIKAKKLTKLDKLRQKFVPKGKIKRLKSPPIKKLTRLRQNLKPIPVPSIKNKATKTATSETLNDKDIYQKAVQVMAEIKSKGKSTTPKKTNITYCDKVSPISIVIEKLDESKLNQPQPITANSEILMLTPRSTRSQSKRVTVDGSIPILNEKINAPKTTNKNEEQKANSRQQKNDNRKRRFCDDKPEIQTKRFLRSSLKKQPEVNAAEPSSLVLPSKLKNSSVSNNQQHCDNQVLLTSIRLMNSNTNTRVSLQNEIHEDNNASSQDDHKIEIEKLNDNINPKDSILCKMIEKYGKTNLNRSNKKISENITNSCCERFDKNMAKIVELPSAETKDAMNLFLDEIRTWDVKYFLLALIKYLKEPARRIEMYNKISTPPAPPMTKSEQILLFIVSQLKDAWSNIDILEMILSNIEYTLFALNRTPDFDTIEAMSHFYAILCRYYGAKSRLRLFVLDAMYCIQFKAVPLIRQCLDVWMHILPLAHMGLAKTPLVSCLVYLLHFFKCEDRFKRVSDIRNILNRKYSYQMADWNETKILEMFRTAILDLRGNQLDRKMLRLALIILAKRHGPQWCQKNIIKNMLQPIIARDNVSVKIKQFCVSMIGPLLKPYPVDMKVHCEVATNQLFDMLDKNPPCSMKEAIYCSLIYMSKHSFHRVIQALLSWKPGNVSKEIEDLLRQFVRSKNVKAWKNILSKTNNRMLQDLSEEQTV